MAPATAATPNASQRGESSGVAWGQMNALATTNTQARPMPVCPSQCSQERVAPADLDSATANHCEGLAGPLTSS